MEGVEEECKSISLHKRSDTDFERWSHSVPTNDTTRSLHVASPMCHS